MGARAPSPGPSILFGLTQIQRWLYDKTINISPPFIVFIAEFHDYLLRTDFYQSRHTQEFLPKGRQLHLQSLDSKLRRQPSAQKGHAHKRDEHQEPVGEKVLSALLPVLDDLERARDNMQKATDVESLREGVEMIIGKLDKTLAAQGLKRMEPIGTLFDTDFHEAIAMVPVPEDEQKGHVIDCVQTGYLLGEKVVRHAKVVVGQ